MQVASRLVVAGGSVGEGMVASRHGVSFGGGENVFKIKCDDGCTYL